MALSAVVAGLLAEMLSGDLVCLSMYRARDMAKAAGVGAEEFARVEAALMEYWAKKKAGNPMGGLF